MQIPVKRLGQSADVARAVMFFCDPANGFVTGQTLYVCGGASLVDRRLTSCVGIIQADGTGSGRFHIHG